MTTSRPRRLLPPAACLLLLLALVPGSLAQQPATAPTLDLHAYVVQLNRSAEQVTALRQNPAGIARFRQSLPPEWDVRAGNRTFRVSTAWLDSTLAQIEARQKAEAAKWPEIMTRLDFLRAQAEAIESPSAAPSTTAARAKLNAIFRRSEFRGLAGPVPLELWWQRLVARIDRWIAWLLARLHLGTASGNVIAYTLIAVALVLLSLWGWRSLAARSRQAEMRIESGSRKNAGGRMWVGDALAAAERGEFREAIHCAYWAAVSRMEEEGTFSRDRSRTPRELLRLIAPERKERAAFGELSRRFETIWYGNRLPSTADWENTKTQLERIGCLGLSTPEIANS